MHLTHHDKKYADWEKYIRPLVRNPYLKNPNLYLENPKL